MMPSNASPPVLGKSTCESATWHHSGNSLGGPSICTCNFCCNEPFGWTGTNCVWMGAADVTGVGHSKCGCTRAEAISWFPMLLKSVVEFMYGTSVLVD